VSKIRLVFIVWQGVSVWSLHSGHQRDADEYRVSKDSGTWNCSSASAGVG